MKARFAAVRGATIPTLTERPPRNPEVVGELAPAGNATDSPSTQTSQQTPLLRYRRIATTSYPERPYSGEERRQRDRRQAERPTTLDTRKQGIDRRTTGRISVKV